MADKIVVEDLRLTVLDWVSMPYVFGTKDMARLIGAGRSWTKAHASELGGRKLKGRWVFTKANVARAMMRVDS